MAERRPHRRTVVGRVIDRLTGGHPRPESHDGIRRELDQLRAGLTEVARRLEKLEKGRAAGEEASRQLGRDVRGVRQRVEALLSAGKDHRRSLSRLSMHASALVRATYVAAEVPGPLGVLAGRFRLRSQNEEDGIVLALLRLAGVSTRRFVDIGCGGSGGNSGVLAFDMGWSGLMIEARGEQADRLRRGLSHNRGVAVVDTLVTPDNVNALVAEHAMAGEVDLLSIDIDSTDYWVFEALDACRARVVVLEYNALFGPTKAVTIPPTGVPSGAPGAYAGASLAALEQLARRKGYGLVLCEDTGVNAFFVRDGLAPTLPRLTSEEAYRPRRSGDEASGPDAVLIEFARAGLPLVEV